MLAELRSAARAEGMVVHPNKLRKMYLAGYDLAPDVIFDVGVDTGTPWLYKTYPNADFVLIDPLAAGQAAVQDGGLLPGFTFYETALGAAPGKGTLHVPHLPQGGGAAMSSMRTRLDPLAETFSGLAEVDVPVTTLDEIAANHPGRAGLKIDTEGFEAEVLEGASETLKRTDFVILEMSVSKRFDRIAPPSHIIAMLAAAGLQMRDVLAMAHGPGKRGKPRHMDVLFTRWLP